MSSLITQLSTEKNLRQAWDNIAKRPYSQGFDDISITQFRANVGNYLEEARSLLKNGNYTFYPLKLYLKEKDGGGYRPIKIPTVRDRVMQRAIANLITPYLNSTFNLDNNVSFAYVKNKNIEAAANRILELREQGYKYLLKADIIKFFDKVDREILLHKIESALPDKTLMPLIRLALENDIANTEYYERKMGEGYVPNTLVGIAQGSPLSPLFANVFLADFDATMISKGYKLVRYADDFAVMTLTKDDAKTAYSVAQAELKKIKLDLYPLKDDIPQELWKENPKYSEARSCQHLEFLGLRFESGKVYPSASAYKNAMKSVRVVAYDSRLGLADKLGGIAARIQGWSSAYSFTVIDPKRIEKLDEELEDSLTTMLKKHGLVKVWKKTTAATLGIKTFKQSQDKIRAKERIKPAGTS